MDEILHHSKKTPGMIRFSRKIPSKPWVSPWFLGWVLFIRRSPGFEPRGRNRIRGCRALAPHLPTLSARQLAETAVGAEAELLQAVQAGAARRFFFFFLRGGKPMVAMGQKLVPNMGCPGKRKHGPRPTDPRSPGSLILTRTHVFQ